MQIESWCVAYLSEVGQENSGLIGSSRSMLRLARQRTLLYLRSDLKDALVSLEYYTQIYSFHFTSFNYGSPNLHHWGPFQYGPVHSRAVAGYPIHVSVDASSSLLRITCTTWLFQTWKVFTLKQLLKKNCSVINWHFVYRHISIRSIGWGRAWNFLSNLIILLE